MWLCGYAGRSGQPSRAHLFHSRQQKFKDELLQSYCKGRENCLWVTVHGIGSSVSLQQNHFFCDLCTWSHCPHTRLYILKTRNQKSQKKNCCSWHDSIPYQKLEEHEKMLLEHPSYCMIGIDFVCLDIILDKICEQSKYFFSVMIWIFMVNVLNSETSCLGLLWILFSAFQHPQRSVHVFNNI